MNKLKFNLHIYKKFQSIKTELLKYFNILRQYFAVKDIIHSFLD